MSCECDSCIRDEDEVEIHHTCEDCLKEAEARVITPAALEEALGSGAADVDTEPDEVERLIAERPEQLAESYRKACAALERVWALLEEKTTSTAPSAG